MLPEFEKHTKPLSKDIIKKVVPKVAQLLKGCKGYDWQGKRKAMTNYQIRHYLRNSKQKIWIEPSTMRSVIHYIRVNHIVPLLIATQKGYRLAASMEEVSRYLHSLYARNKAVREVIDSITSQKKSARHLPVLTPVAPSTRKARKAVKQKIAANRKPAPKKSKSSKKKYGRKR